MAETVLLAGRNYDLVSMGGNLQFVAKRKRSEKEWKPEREQRARSFFSAEVYFKLTAFSGFVVNRYGRWLLYDVSATPQVLVRKKWAEWKKQIICQSNTILFTARISGPAR